MLYEGDVLLCSWEKLLLFFHSNCLELLCPLTLQLSDSCGKVVDQLFKKTVNKMLVLESDSYYCEYFSAGIVEL